MPTGLIGFGKANYTGVDPKQEFGNKKEEQELWLPVLGSPVLGSLGIIGGSLVTLRVGDPPSVWDL